MRLLLAGFLALALTVGVAIVVLTTEEAEHEFTPAPESCIDGWNRDPEAPSTLGVHQYDAHGYNRVQVLTLSRDGSAPVAPGNPGAVCAVLFASNTLDPEAAAAAFVRRSEWTPLSTLQPTDELAKYQAQAQREYNAELQSDGTIDSL
jgi:hypothetical protein